MVGAVQLLRIYTRRVVIELNLTYYYYYYRQDLPQAALPVPVLFLLTADFLVFRPAGATRCTDQGEIWHGGADHRSAPSCQISP